jgi:hypothetical protein
MKKNIGNIDRIVRIILAVVFAALYFMQVITGTIGLVLLIAGGVLLATALVDFCPLYKIFGINTIPPEEED